MKSNDWVFKFFNTINNGESYVCKGCHEEVVLPNPGDADKLLTQHIMDHIEFKESNKNNSVTVPETPRLHPEDKGDNDSGFVYNKI